MASILALLWWECQLVRYLPLVGFALVIGVYALLVDAVGVLAKSFCERYGFIPLVDAPMSLCLTLGCV